MLSKIRKNIRVATIFEPGRGIRPVWFEWNHQRHLVKETTYSWKGKKGEAALLHFAVTDEANLFELTYNTADQSWTLEGVEAG